MEEITDVRWTPEALDDLDALRDFVAARNPIAASGVVARVFRTVSLLAGAPSIGHAGRVPGTREFVVTRTPYFVVYRVAGGTLRIDRVIHGAREWPPASS